MGKYEKIWVDIFRHVMKRRAFDVEADLSGKRLGVDMETWLYDNKHYFLSCVQAIGHQRKTYKPRLLMETIQIRHDRFLRIGVEPIYVFRGFDNPLRIVPKHEESKTNLVHEFYLTTLQDQPKIQRSRRWKMDTARFIVGGRLADRKLTRFLAEWMQSQGMQVVGAPMEAAWQLVAMEQDGTIDAIMSTAANVLVAGAHHMLLGYRMGKVMNLEARRYHRELDLTDKVHRFDFTGRKGELLPAAYTLLGSEYFGRLDGTPMRKVMKDIFPRYVKALADGRGFWVDEMERTTEFARRFDHAVAQFRHGPVMRPTTQPTLTDPSYSLEPLQPLPEGRQWPEVLGYDPREELPIPSSDYSRAFKFQDGITFIKEFNVLHPWFDDLHPSHDEDKYTPEDLLEICPSQESEYDPAVALDAEDDWSDWRHVNPTGDP